MEHDDRRGCKRRFSPRQLHISIVTETSSSCRQRPFTEPSAARARHCPYGNATNSGRSLALSTHTRRWRFSGPVTDVLCKLPFAEFFEKNRIRCKRSLQHFYQRREQDCSRPAAFKNATVRERPVAEVQCGEKRTLNAGVQRRPFSKRSVPVGRRLKPRI